MTIELSQIITMQPVKCPFIPQTYSLFHVQLPSFLCRKLVSRNAQSSEASRSASFHVLSLLPTPFMNFDTPTFNFSQTQMTHMLRWALINVEQVRWCSVFLLPLLYIMFIKRRMTRCGWADVIVLLLSLLSCQTERVIFIPHVSMVLLLSGTE